MTSVNRVLFDVPGPRGRRTIAIVTVITVVIIAAVVAWAVWLFAQKGQLAPERWAEFTQWPYVQFLIGGLGNTLLCTVVAGIVAFPFAVLLALGRLSSLRWLSKLSGAWVEFFRSIPLLLVVYVFVGGLPSLGVNLPLFWKLVVPIIVCASAVIAEVFRAAILALPKGQTEAALALGLSRGQAMRKVVLPQAIRLAVPSLVTQVVSLLKDSTLGYAASYPELMKSGKNLTAYTGHLIQTYLVISVIYIVINLLLSQLARSLEQRQERRGRRGARATEQRVAETLAPNTI